MRRIGIGRRMVIIAVAMGSAMAAPAGAMALSTHSATTSSVNSAGQFAATARCGATEHVVSGGFNISNKGANEGAAVVSRAVKSSGWKVRLYSESGETLTTYAYCAPKGQLSTSTHHSEMAAPDQGVNTTATARCSSGETLVSGGYAFLPSSGEVNSPTYRDYAASATKWTVMSAFDVGPVSVEAFGYCGRGVVVKVRSSTSASIPDGGNGSATARCHKGETLLSGGYTTTPKPDWFNSTGPDFFYNSSHRSGARSWTASAWNFSSVSGKITAFAYCMP